MQVKKIMLSTPEIAPTAHRFTQEELQIEFNYLQADRMHLYVPRTGMQGDCCCEGEEGAWDGEHLQSPDHPELEIANDGI